MLTKTANYFCDREAVLERSVTGDKRRPYGSVGAWELDGRPESQRHGGKLRDNGGGGRNLRSVLAIPTASGKIKHFATFPPRLVEPLIKAATSEKGCCPVCGSPWARVVDHQRTCDGVPMEPGCWPRDEAGRLGPQGIGHWRFASMSSTIGWLPTCSCDTQHEPVPCWVLDPFCGSGTVSLVCTHLGLDSVGIDTSAKYIRFAEDRLAEDAKKRDVACP